MKVSKLEIRRPASYERNDNDFGFIGHVEVVGQHGEQKFNLSPAAISRIFAQIQQEIGRTAQKVAGQVEEAVQDAIDGGLLLQQDGAVKVPVNAPSFADEPF